MIVTAEIKFMGKRKPSEHQFSVKDVSEVDKLIEKRGYNDIGIEYMEILGASEGLHE